MEKIKKQFDAIANSKHPVHCTSCDWKGSRKRGALGKCLKCGAPVIWTFEKTKLETTKDMATAVNGLIENSQSVYEKCIQELGEDYGMYQVLALLRLAKQELEETIDYLEVRR